LIALQPRVATLTEWFLANWPRFDPTLAEDALDELQRALGDLPRSQARDEAIRWIWEEDISLDGAQIGQFLRGLAGAWHPTSSRNRLRLEERVRKILMALADEIGAGCWVLTGTNPRTHQRDAPDPALIEDLTGTDRSRNRSPTVEGMIRHLRIQATPAHDPAQKGPPLNQTPPALAKITPERWAKIWKMYLAHVCERQKRHQRDPHIDEDSEWRQRDEVKITRAEMRALRAARRAAASAC